MTEEEFHRLLRGTTALFRRVLTFQWWTGCRPGEMSVLLWDWVDWEARVVVIPWQHHKTGKYRKKPKILILEEPIVKLLRWLQRRAKGPRIFSNARGGPWNRSNLSLRIQRLRERTGVPADCHLYGTRHALGTRLVAAGMPLKHVAQILGHASATTTERYYVHMEREIGAVRESLERARKAKQ